MLIKMKYLILFLFGTILATDVLRFIIGPIVNGKGYIEINGTLDCFFNETDGFGFEKLTIRKYDWSHNKDNYCKITEMHENYIAIGFNCHNRNETLNINSKLNLVFDEHNINFPNTRKFILNK